MGAEPAAHTLKYDTVLGALQAVGFFTDEATVLDVTEFETVPGRVPAEMHCKGPGVEANFESRCIKTPQKSSRWERPDKRCPGKTDRPALGPMAG